MQKTLTSLAALLLINQGVFSQKTLKRDGRTESPGVSQLDPIITARPRLIKLPFAFWDTMENTPVLFNGWPLLVLDYPDDSKGWHDQYAASTYTYTVDSRTGQRIAEFGRGYSAHKAFVDGKRLYVFATELTNYEWFQNMYCFWTEDLKTWHRELAIKRKDNVPKNALGIFLSAPFNGSVCRDDSGFLMAYVYFEGFPWFEFARSRDLIHWNKIPDLAFSGKSGKQYSNTPAIRYFAPYYYVIYYTTVDETGHMVTSHGRYASYLARSKDLVTWQLSPMNPVLQPETDEGISTSDVEILELEGNTYLFYATSTQTARPPGWSAVRAAMYPGPMKQFFEGWFPEGAKRTREADQKKTDVGISMIRRAISGGVSFGYVLVDSWFMSGKMIRSILSLPGKHLLGMGKMNGTKYTFQDKDFTAKELCDRLSRKKKGKRNRSLHMTRIQVNVHLQEIPLCLFFYRNTDKGPWHFLISTDLNLTPLKAYKMYARRWNIEIYKEIKGFIGLNDCHSRDFDALIAHTSVPLIAYNMFSTAKRLNSYETLGDLFREVAGQRIELTLSERIWAVIEELLKFVSEYFDINFESFVQSLMQKGDPESELLRIIQFSNASAA